MLAGGRKVSPDRTEGQCQDGCAIEPETGDVTGPGEPTAQGQSTQLPPLSQRAADVTSP